TLYNIPAGMHNIAIKKEGYVDYSMDVNVEAGKKAFIEADLVAEVKEPEVPEAEEIVEEVIEETKPIEAIEEEEEKITKEPEGLEGKNTINIGKKLQFYYDFSDGKFTDSSNADSDVFSRRFDTYLVFTRFSPVNIKAINKKIENANKEDCVGIKGTFEYLYSGRSLCIITKEGKIAAIGGYWVNTENANLSWKVFD
ncbi:MAG: PEGA domain-containing protein, partial [Nanoarchaeota archaeon]